MFPDLKTYEELAKNYNLIPVYSETLADMETPVSVLSRFISKTNVFLLESMEGGEKWGRYSFVGIDPEPFVVANHSGGKSDDLNALRDVYRGVRCAPIGGLPRFCGGAVGFLAYEAIGDFERMPKPRPSASGRPPQSRFVKADLMIVFDNVRHTIKTVAATRPGNFPSPAAAYEHAAAAIRNIEATLEKQHTPPPRPAYPVPVFESNMSKEEFCGIVEQAKKYIHQGDAIQVVLSQKFSAETSLPPLAMYRALRLLNPSPYTFFLKIGDQTLVGSSPEVMVRLTGSRVELRPIAGTRPRGANEQEDRRLADELLSDEKEKAEHVMLVDLGRNDVGRVSEPGSVQVSDYMTIERYSHVMHLVSHVEGILKPDLDALDVIKASFPAGTLTGAPKIRAMEIINELEPAPRHAYGGAVGYIGYDGNMDLAITIRTLDIVGRSVVVQAGAGIVFDSVPEREYEETCHKSRAMRRAVEMAAAGLVPDPERGFPSA